MSEKKREWAPRTTPAEKLFADNQRLQRKCHAHKIQIKAMQKRMELLNMRFERDCAVLNSIRKELNQTKLELWDAQKTLEKVTV